MGYGDGMAKKNRFVTTQKTGALSGTKVIVDTETGVQYLWAFEGYGGGLTVMLDRDGKPLLDRQYAGPPDGPVEDGLAHNG
jgi:hypothetical protein